MPSGKLFWGRGGGAFVEQVELTFRGTTGGGGGGGGRGYRHASDDEKLLWIQCRNLAIAVNTTMMKRSGRQQGMSLKQLVRLTC